MSMTVDTAFVKQYERDVHLDFQRMGAKLRNRCRTKNGVIGTSDTFQRIGTGEATQKARHGTITPMNATHTAVECTLSDWFAGDWVDILDMSKINIDERAALVKTGAYALGRKADGLIIDKLATTTVSAPTTAGGMTLAKVMEAMQKLGENNVPWDGQLTAVVAPKQWTELLQIAQFASADYVDDTIYNAGVPRDSRLWLGTVWIMHTGLPKSGNDRSCFWFHKNAMGHCIGQDIKSDFDWQGDRAAWFVNNMMSMGATLIQTEGVCKITCAE
jgi:hypothetical protein